MELCEEELPQDAQHGLGSTGTHDVQRQEPIGGLVTPIGRAPDDPGSPLEQESRLQSPVATVPDGERQYQHGDSPPQCAETLLDRESHILQATLGEDQTVASEKPEPDEMDAKRERAERKLAVEEIAKAEERQAEQLVAEQEKLAAAEAEAAKAQAEKLQAEQLAAEQAAAEAEQKAQAEKLQAERLATEQEGKLAAELAAEAEQKAQAEKLQAERLATKQEEKSELAAEAEAVKAQAEKLQAEQLAAEQAGAEAEQKAQAETAQANKLAGKRAANASEQKEKAERQAQSSSGATSSPSIFQALNRNAAATLLVSEHEASPESAPAAKAPKVERAKPTGKGKGKRGKGKVDQEPDPEAAEATDNFKEPAAKRPRASAKKKQ